METPKSGPEAMDLSVDFMYDALHDEETPPEGLSLLNISSMGTEMIHEEKADPLKQQTSPKRSSNAGGQRRKSSGDEYSGLTQGKRTRASGEILTYLINEFNKNSNPTTQLRKSIALKTGMPERSVRIWFQNRRAKARKMEKLQKNGGSYVQVTGTTGGEIYGLLSKIDSMPIDINEKYSFIDSKCISVGSWQRIRTGNANAEYLNDMINLSPKMIYSLMESTDLLVILSKKDQEVNYFFSGVFQNDKVLFRIFYPIISIVKSSILNQSQQPGEGEIEYKDTLLQIDLTTSPKFAVHFLRDPTTGKENPNQWSICEDFSEGQQVALAHTGEGGSQVGHILTGDTEHLKYLNTYIMAELQSGGSHQQSTLSLSQRESSSSSSFPDHSYNNMDINENEMVHLSTSNINTPQYSTDYHPQSDQLHDLLMYNNNSGINMNMAVFNGSGTIDSEGLQERPVDSPGLDLFRTTDTASTASKPTTGDMDDLDLGPMLTSSVKNEYFINDDGFL